MVFPLIKIVSLGVKTLSRPLLTYLKNANKKHLKEHHPLHIFFCKAGNFQYALDVRITKSLATRKYAGDLQIKPLRIDAALERGIEFTYEVIFYFLITVVTIVEVYRSMADSQQKKDEQTKRLAHIKNILEEREEMLSQMQKLHSVRYEEHQTQAKSLYHRTKRIKKQCEKVSKSYENRLLLAQRLAVLKELVEAAETVTNSLINENIDEEAATFKNK